MPHSSTCNHTTKYPWFNRQTKITFTNGQKRHWDSSEIDVDVQTIPNGWLEVFYYIDRHIPTGRAMFPPSAILSVEQEHLSDEHYNMVNEWFKENHYGMSLEESQEFHAKQEKITFAAEQIDLLSILKTLNDSRNGDDDAFGI